MAPTLILTGLRIVRTNYGPLVSCSRLMSQDVSQPKDDIKNAVPVLGKGKFPDPSAAPLKRGTGGRSSFNGTVCTVFGGGGLLGKALVNKLGKIGTQVIIPYRGDPYEVRTLKLAGDLGQILFLPFYLRDEETIYRAMKYSNVVVNLIGHDAETPSFEFNDVHVDGARRIARIARESGVKRFIHLSALNANPSPTPHALRTGSKFYKSKYYGELAVREEFPEAIIFRPSDMYGELDKYFCYWSSWWRRAYRKCHLWGKGRGVYKRPVWCSDVAQGITNAIFDNSMPGKTIDAVGPRCYELQELVRFYGECCQKGPFQGHHVTDLRFYPWFWFRIFMTEQVRKYPLISWELIERECTSDVLTPGNPTLEDLGVKLSYVEVMAPFLLARFRKYGWMDQDLGEFPAPVPPPPIEFA